MMFVMLDFFILLHDVFIHEKNIDFQFACDRPWLMQ